MHVVVMGCGRVGTLIAQRLEAAGHTVAIIDQNREAFRRLGPNFQGITLTGVGFDRDILIQAGIERADAFAAVSNGDNSNILAARVARENFGVANVVARIYDPGRAEIYQRLGIPTVATVIWTADQILRRLAPEGSLSEWQDASGMIRLAEVHLDSGWFGQPATYVEESTGARIAMITRLGKGMLIDEHTVIQEGDLVHLMMKEGDLARIESTLAVPPVGR